MGLSALDYVFFTNNQLHHQQWLEQTHFRTKELQQQLAEQAGGASRVSSNRSCAFGCL